jgi:hypothetical protein
VLDVGHRCWLSFGFQMSKRYDWLAR